MVTLLVALQIWCLSKVRTCPAGRKGDLGNFFYRFHQKPVLITLHITWDQIFLTEKSRIMEFFSWKRLIIQCYNLFCKGSACFDVVDIEWVQIVLQNCEKLQNYRAKKEQILSEVCMIKKGLIVLFTWDVSRKSMFKSLVYTPPDSSPRFTCKLCRTQKIRPDFLFWPPF